MSERYSNKVLRDWDYPATCDICGDRFWASTMKWSAPNTKNGKEYFVDDDCYDPYQESNKLKVVNEDRSVPVARPYNVEASDSSNAGRTAAQCEYWYVQEF